MDRYLDKIRTQYWLSVIYHSLAQAEIPSIERQIVTLENRVANKVKGAKKELRDATNKKARFFENKMKPKEFLEKLASYGSRMPQGDELSQKVWKDYKSGKRSVKIETVSQLEGLAPGSKSAFQDGPFKLFKMMEANSLRNAMQVISESVILELEDSRCKWEQDRNMSSKVRRLCAELDKPKYLQRPDIQIKIVHDILSFSSADILKETDLILIGKLMESPDQAPSYKMNYDEHFKSLSKKLFAVDITSSDYFSEFQLAVFYLGLAFIRSKYLGTSVMLSTVFLNPKYFNVIEAYGNISTKLWSILSRLNSHIADEIKVAKRYHNEIQEKLIAVLDS
ncbi:hypothetical protein MACH26_01400 [Planctobacterium marinum]|uniref:Uncharacterized protein n=2 Tax=Planctobacterium marinum TaxID=1631968 RepID=A0AA48HMK8_9ALTE|nr:hypothetical protein MACH26_01400 [Planctobacterium marinum]